MDQIVEMVSSKTGIGADQARTAVETVLNFLKDKLPAPIAGQIDGLLSGGAGAGGGLMEQASGMLGGLMGGGSQAEGTGVVPDPDPSDDPSKTSN